MALGLVCGCECLCVQSSVCVYVCICMYKAKGTLTKCSITEVLL